MSAWEKKVGRFRKACWSFHEQCQTFRLAKRAYRLYHHYDYATTPAAYVIGRGHPASIVAYLQFRAEREMPFEAQLENEGAALLLTKFYGYKETPPTDACEDVDLYEIREFRCERKWHNRIARLLYWRPEISRELAPCVEEC